MKHAPPAMSVSESGTSALAVAPLKVLRAQRPLGSETVPGRTSGVTFASQCTSPRSLKTRTVSPSAMTRGLRVVRMNLEARDRRAQFAERR